ncbi:hypothetical protein F5Y14DRAFT_398566 [Nemania sp. NC0429]|nr:hypothetical protein F5Y14DRAFT_398566 [Nemania sp. NC0429]
MATSRFETQMYTSENYVESAGTVLFHLSTRKLCVLHLLETDEYVLPKGRRKVGEAANAAAIRETVEETGIPCRLLPINLASRVCPVIEGENVPDEARFYEAVCEPVAVQLRRLGEGNMKLTWWYVAAVNEDEPTGRHEAHTFGVELLDFEDAVQKLTFRDNRELVRKAIELVNSTLASD